MFHSDPYDKQRDDRLDDLHAAVWTDEDTDALARYMLEGSESPPNGEEA